MTDVREVLRPPARGRAEQEQSCVAQFRGQVVGWRQQGADDTPG